MATLPMIPETLKTQERGSTSLDGKNKKKCTNSVDSQDTLPRKAPKLDWHADQDKTMALQWGLSIGKSTLWSWIQNRHYCSGEFLQSSERDCKFCDKILKINPSSKVINPTTVLHFKCSKEYQMKEPYNTANFRVHHENAKELQNLISFLSAAWKKLTHFLQRLLWLGVLSL